MTIDILEAVRDCVEKLSGEWRDRTVSELLSAIDGEVNERRAG